jgi:hypothetical protein
MHRSIFRAGLYHPVKTDKFAVEIGDYRTGYPPLVLETDEKCPATGKKFVETVPVIRLPVVQRGKQLAFSPGPFYQR